ncbi:MAG: hypothetical protein HQM12_20340 [SAR324 cluster bacterium]|nr:hypothetical protein [SAR324 cluster bacterium]
MLKSYEAIYQQGLIHWLEETPTVQSARVLVTFIQETPPVQKRRQPSPKLAGIMTLPEDIVQFQVPEEDWECLK